MAYKQPASPSKADLSGLLISPQKGTAGLFDAGDSSMTPVGGMDSTNLSVGQNFSTLLVNATKGQSVDTMETPPASTMSAGMMKQDLEDNRTEYRRQGGNAKPGRFFLLATCFVALLAMVLSFVAFTSLSDAECEEIIPPTGPLDSEFDASFNNEGTNAAGTTAGVAAGTETLANDRSGAAVASIFACTRTVEEDDLVFTEIQCLTLTYTSGHAVAVGSCGICENGEFVVGAEVGETFAGLTVGFTPSGPLGFLEFRFLSESGLSSKALGSSANLEGNDLYTNTLQAGENMQLTGLTTYVDGEGITGVKALVKSLDEPIPSPPEIV